MRNTLTPSSFIVAAVLFVVSPSFAQKPDRILSTNNEDLKRTANKELIDQFTTVTDYGVGFHPTAWASGFVAVEGEPRFSGGILGSQKPSVHPAMKELVRRGVDALPDLIAHLSDERKTRLSINAGGFAGATWHSDEYDSRYHDTKRLPKGANTGKEELLKDNYALPVGDLCYVAIGQIVNRQLKAVRYQPSGCYVINSPVATPQLAEAVKSEWSRLTAAEHERSLIADAQNPHWAAAPPALERLAFYYPHAAEKVATTLLARQLYDNDVVWNFIRDELVSISKVEDWRNLVDEFRAKHGKNIAESIPYWLHWIYWKTDFERSAKFQREQKVAGEILSQVFPDYDIENPPLFNAAELRDQVSIVRAVRHLKSQQVDDAVHQLFLSASSAKLEIPDELAELNVQRLQTTEKLRVYVPFFERRVEELKKDLTEIADDVDLQKYIEQHISEYEKILTSIKK